MVTRSPQLPAGEEDHNFLVTIRTATETLRRIPCRLWLPRRVGDRPTLLLSATGSPLRDFTQRLRPPFSLSGSIRGYGPQRIRISANQVWLTRTTSRHFGRDRVVMEAPADPVDLRVETRRANRLAARLRATCLYHLTDCQPLEPRRFISHYPNGTVRVRTIHKVRFRLIGGTRLSFEMHERREVRAGEGTLSYFELVAVAARDLSRSRFLRPDDQTLSELDDFLDLVSFAARHRTACLGVTYYGDDAEVRLYRGDLTRPKNRSWDWNRALVDAPKFGRFLQQAYRAYVHTGPADLITRALYLAGEDPKTITASTFTSLYSALEMIVAWHCERTGGSLIIENDGEWRSLRTDLRGFLREHASLSGADPGRRRRRRLIEAKLVELRRVPFRALLEEFRTAYDVRWDDLWPIFDPGGGVSLTDIRNRIVHGNTFDRRQELAILSATLHLKWAVERALLAVLGWPLAMSRVRPDYLARVMVPMQELEADRIAMGRGGAR